MWDIECGLRPVSQTKKLTANMSLIMLIPKRLAMQIPKLESSTLLSCHCQLSSASSTVAARLVILEASALDPATAELEPSATSFPPATFPKLQLDSRELGSAAFDEGPASVLEVVTPDEDDTGSPSLLGIEGGAGEVDWPVSVAEGPVCGGARL